MNNIPIVDTHLHLWDINHLSYPWLNTIPTLHKSFFLKDYKQACDGIDIERMVFVQCECVPDEFMKEVQWVTALAAEDSRIQGIVAGASLEKGERIRPVLGELAENKLVKGVRRLIESETDLEFCLQPNLIEGIRILEEYDLRFDIACNHRHLKNIAAMVSRCPKVKFVLDHIGKPDIKGRVFEPWSKDIKTLSELPNLWCKISGLVVEADHKNWTREDLKPYIDHVIKCFGFERIMFGGDWPVSLLVADYPRWLETLQWAVADCCETEKKRLFHDNALDFYKL